MTGRIACIPIGDQAYNHRHRNTNNWFGLIFITGFVGIVQHDAHMSVPPFKNPEKRLMLVARTSYSPPKTPNDLLHHGNATHLVKVAYNTSHFVVLQYDILNREVIVYDGLRMSIDSGSSKSSAPSNSLDSRRTMPNAIRPRRTSPLCLISMTRHPGRYGLIYPTGKVMASIVVQLLA